MTKKFNNIPPPSVHPSNESKKNDEHLHVPAKDSERHDDRSISLAKLHVSTSSSSSHIVIRLVNFNLFYKIINKSLFFSTHFPSLALSLSLYLFVCTYYTFLPRFGCQLTENISICVALVVADVGLSMYAHIDERNYSMYTHGYIVHALRPATAFNAQKYHIYPKNNKRGDSSYECITFICEYVHEYSK